MELKVITNLKAVPKGFVRLPLKCLVKAKWNYKKDDAETARKLAANIKRNGQVQNIIVRDLGKGKFEIANGNHRLDAFLTVGMKDAICFNLGKVSQAVAERVAIETNETNFETDPVKLGKVMEHLMEDYAREDLLATMPYSDVDFEALIAAGGFNPEDDVPEPPDGENPFLKSDVPVSKILNSLGIKTVPQDMVEPLSARLLKAVDAWKIPKAERWKVLEKIALPLPQKGKKSK